MLPEWTWLEWVQAVGFLIGSYLAAGALYGIIGSKVWGIRGEKGQYDKVLNRIYTKSPIKRDIMYIHGSTEKFQKEIDLRFKTFEKKFEFIEGKISEIYDTIFLFESRLSTVVDSITSLESRIPEDFSLDSDQIVEKLYLKIRGLQGQQTAMANKELKELQSAAADVASIEYPALVEVAGKLDAFIDLGIIDESYAEKFLKIATNPLTQPIAEKAAEKLLDWFNNGGKKSSGSGNRNFW